MRALSIPSKLFILPHSHSSIFIMSLIKTEPVDPYLSGAIATGRPKLEVLVDDDPDSVYYNGPFVKVDASVKEECSLDVNPVGMFSFAFYESR